MCVCVSVECVCVCVCVCGCTLIHTIRVSSIEIRPSVDEFLHHTNQTSLSSYVQGAGNNKYTTLGTVLYVSMNN